MEDRVNRECADEDGPSTDELRAGTPEDGAEHVADEEKGKYEVAYFPPYVKVMRDDRHRGGWCRRSESAVADKVSTTWQLAPGAGTYTLSVAVVEIIVIHNLYQKDQFCGFSGSSGPSHLTRFGSVFGLGRKGSGGGEDLFFGVGSCEFLLS